MASAWVILGRLTLSFGGDDGLRAQEQEGPDVLPARQGGHPPERPPAADLLLRARREARRGPGEDPRRIQDRRERPPRAALPEEGLSLPGPGRPQPLPLTLTSTSRSA